tara:strand:- start:148 stop:444 length:297 start_codon:yes stop_codon:yes gene_type:complete
MKNHTKIYMAALGYDETDFMPCEITGRKGVDIHHIVNRDNRIENLMLLTREKHVELGEIKSKMAFLLLEHRLFLYNNGVKFNENWFKEQIDKYISYAD